MSEEQPTPIDQALLEKLNVLRQIVTIDQLLANGMFPGSAAKAIQEAQLFLKSLHAPIMAEAQTHPDFARASGQSEQSNV